MDQDNLNNVDENVNSATIMAKPTDVSRSELMASLVNYANHIGSKDELASFVASLPNAAEMTHSNDEIYNSTQQASGDANKNKGTIKSAGAPADAMKSVKEDLSLLFGEDLGLSEDFRLRTEALFEAAVSTRVSMELSKIEDQYEDQLNESIEAVRNEMVENVDAYLNYAVAEWIKENEIGIHNNIRTDITESFMDGLKGLFEDHYIEIPDNKVDVVESMASKIEELESKLNEMTENNIELTKLVSEKEVKDIADGIAEDLTDTQRDKFYKLVEAINYSDLEEFQKKVSIIKETYFSTKNEVRHNVKADQLLSEEVDDVSVTNVNANIEPDMRAYVQSLSRTIKR